MTFAIKERGGAKKQKAKQVQANLVITIDDKHYLVDTGFGRRSPRYPLHVSFIQSEEIECCEGERYRLEVTPDVFTLFEQLADDSWFPLYAFPREAETNFPRTVT